MLFGAATAQVATIVLGYGWPAYQSYKATTLGNSRLEREWLIYWIVLAFYLLLQWMGDALIFWLPLYYEAKVACVVCLWHPRVKGAAYIFSTYLAPMLRSHEAGIDRNLGETKIRLLDYVNGQVQRAKEYASTNSSKILEHVKSFSEQSSRPEARAAHLHRE